jgi:hypothetical protein
MSNFKKVLSKLSAERGYSWRFDGQDPTTESEYNSSVDWHDASEKITWAEIQSELYKLNRADEYPSIGDQLDALWKGGVAAEEMLALVQAVKTKYPKP